MNKEQVRIELLERYDATGRVGLSKPVNRKEAMSLINTLSELYVEEPEEVVLTLKEMSKKLTDFFNKY